MFSQTTVRRVVFYRQLLLDGLIILVVAYFYCGASLLDFKKTDLQTSGEHNESATLPLLAEVGINRHGEIPLWNPYMLTGFPLVGDFINHLWHPVSTIPIMIWGGINGMKVSVFIAFVLAGWGQWLFTHIFGVRSFFRLWSGLTFMLSGGLAFFWRLGWYELVLGMAWFPWCFAALWWSLKRRDMFSLGLTALCVTMVLTTGGGYYPVYLFVCLSLLTLVAIVASPSKDRWRKLFRAVVIVMLSAGLAAVALLPLWDGYLYTFREAGLDVEQGTSLPILYALFNYVIPDHTWFTANALGKINGSHWFYMGYLSLGALIFVPWAFAESPNRRRTITALFVLISALLLWQANRYFPVNFLYDLFPALYTLRLPQRLLTLTASPILALSAIGMHHLFLAIRRHTRAAWVSVSVKGESTAQWLSLNSVAWSAMAIVISFDALNVFNVNQSMGFLPSRLNSKSLAAIRWIKEQDPTLYYISLGVGPVYWDWTPAGYDLEVPIINFDYGRRMISYDKQRQPTSPFYALPKYVIAAPDQLPPPPAQRLRDFEGVNIWRIPNALPFAFSAPPDSLKSGVVLNFEEATPVRVQLDGPNRVIARGQPARPGEQLVVLVSNYPGWRVKVDGQLASLQTINDYLGATMLPGDHTYIFEFSPTPYYIGLIISSLSLLAVVIVSVMEARRLPVFKL